MPRTAPVWRVRAAGGFAYSRLSPRRNEADEFEWTSETEHPLELIRRMPRVKPKSERERFLCEILEERGESERVELIRLQVGCRRCCPRASPSKQADQIPRRTAGARPGQILGAGQ